jgi:hypothetical protein
MPLLVRPHLLPPDHTVAIFLALALALAGSCFWRLGRRRT